MATHISSRSLLSKLPTTTKPLAFLMSRSFSSTPIAPLLTNPTSSHSLFRSLATSSPHLGRSFPAIRSFWSRAISNLDDEKSKWSSWPPEVERPGRDFEHWFVVKEEPDPNSTRDEIIDTYVKTLALVIGSVQVARMPIYSVSTKFYYAFGARVPEEVAIKIAELPNIKRVIPDHYVNVETKDYGGKMEPFINGQAVPYHPKYHKDQIRNSREPEIIRKNPPEDNIPPSGNYDVPPKMEEREWIRHYYLSHMPSGSNLYRLPPNMGGVPQGNYVRMPPQTTYIG